MNRVFISYSHDSDSHRRFVRDVSDRLRRDGLDCRIDQYVPGFPEEGWQNWMERQIEVADFVLVVCTPLYLRRFRGEDPGGGRGVRFEGLVLSNILYDQFYHNAKFIPVIPDTGSLDDVPLRLKGYSVYRLNSDYLKLYRVLTAQPLVVPSSIGTIKILPPESSSTTTNPHHKIILDRLPITRDEFFGREEELRLLDTAWAGDGARIVQLIAPGGVGKTKLLRHWIDQHDSIETLLAWSFYSQGSSEDKQVSASPFFEAVLKLLEPGSEQPKFVTEEERGEHLAALLRQNRCLLVLDGLEPLQYADRGMRGELKDRAVRTLLRSLAGGQAGLCVITSRIAVDELCDRAHVVNCNLDNLGLADGMRLLRSLKVRGSDTELEQAVREYGCHALALSLLGNALSTFGSGDVRQRDVLPELLDDGDPQSRHARKVMQAYTRWLGDTPELRLLRMLGLFEHPIGKEELKVLWNQAIPGLSDGLTEGYWKRALNELQEHHRLMYASEGPVEVFDCHPLIREYFGAQLREEQPEAWRQAHERLYEYYLSLPYKELPDTLEEMQPLFHAIAHGCAAGRYQRTLEEVYWRRVNRGSDYLCHKLGAFGDDLSSITKFFIIPWSSIFSEIDVHLQITLFNWAGFRLSALGRLHDAVEPMELNISLSVQKENWLEAATGTVNLSELQLTVGNISAAISSAERSIDYAGRSEDLFMRIVSRTTLAHALHQADEPTLALELFKEAERLQQALQPNRPYLYSRRGFRFCELLLAQNEAQAVLQRTSLTLDLVAASERDTLSVATDKLTLGLAHAWLAIGRPITTLVTSSEIFKTLKANSRKFNHKIMGQEEHWFQARTWLNQSLIALRNSGYVESLIHGLLAQAAYSRWNGSTADSRNNLLEAHAIATRGHSVHERDHMRLHLIDYHLESARVALAEANRADSIEHTAAAAKLIVATGYKRRLLELEELQVALGIRSTKNP